MRGIIFTTFTDFIESEFGYETLDEILISHNYPNYGGFSSGSNYDIQHFFQMIIDSSKYFNGGQDELLFLFGKYAFNSLILKFRQIYKDNNSFFAVDNAFDFIQNLNEIHFEELHKLYPNSQFPRFEIVKGDSSIELTYSSPLQLHYLAKGLLEGCIEFFKDDLTLSMSIGEDNKSSTFYIKREVR